MDSSLPPTLSLSPCALCLPLSHMQVEQRQFQEYADNVISMARARGAPIQPLVRAVQAGTGGGKGPVFTGKAGVRPSYQVSLLT